MRNTLVNRIAEYAKKDRKIFLISGDAGFGVLDSFQKDFPDRFLNLGVAEQNTISFAAGLALAGFKVFVYNIAPFVMYRCYEQVRNDICYQKLPVTLIGIGSGLTYAPQGMTHYSVEDVAVGRTLPNLTILSPSDPLEAASCADYALKSKGPLYIRIAKSGEAPIHKEKPKDIKNPLVIKEGRKVAVLFYGSVGIEVIKAIQDIKESPLIVSMPMIQPLNFRALLKRLRDCRTIITVEEHFLEGGLGSIIADWLVKEKLSFKLIKLGIRNEFIYDIKNNAGMRKKYRISCADIKKTIKKAWRDA